MRKSGPVLATVLFAGLLGVTPTVGQDPTKVRLPRLLRSPTVSKTHIVFAFADDLWIVPREGGDARRLTANPGVENDPVFSPDGKMIAFTGQYDGNDDVYVVPVAGGDPRRLTYHPGIDAAVGWTPDGKSVLFRSSRNNYARTAQLFTVGLEGGLPTELPLPMAHHGTYSADGKHLAYVPMINHPARAGTHVPWNQYRGGKAPWIWLAKLEDSSVERIPRKDSNDTYPMWIGDRVYFLSDRDGPATLYSFATESKEIKKLIDNAGEDDIRSASSGPGVIAYEKPAGIYLYDLETGKSNLIDITIQAEMPATRPRFLDVGDQVRQASLSPSGSRVALEARGEVFTVPASKGDVRNVTGTSGAAERDPAWSPDGKWIAYFSDESGEYELHLRPLDRKEKVRKITPGDGPSFFYRPTWSPDSKSIAYTDKKLNLWVVDVESGKSRKIDTNPYFDRPIGSVAWSPDSQWLAYAKQLPSHLNAIFLHTREGGKPIQLTDGMSDATDVSFDRGGKYLYFTASTDVGPSRGSVMSALDRPTSRNAYLVVLAADQASPLAPESDEEKPDAEKPKKDGKDGGKKETPKVRIDLEDIDQRILALPVPAKNYVSLISGKEGVLFLLEAPEVQRMRAAGGPPTPPALTLHRFELAKRKAEKFLEGLTGGVDVSNNGEKLLYPQGNKWFVVGSAAPPKPGEGALALDKLQMRVDPRAEWRQIFREAVRIQRDFLYDPGFHGLDLKKASQRYERYLDGLGSRYDLNYLMAEMLGGLCLGHVYITGGDAPRPPRVTSGLLGCDYELSRGRYRIKKIYRGENWNAALRAPLTQPGTRVKEGEYLLAIDGVDLKDTDSIDQLLEGKAGKSVSLRVGPSADGKGDREVTVVPVADEQPLRHFAWVTANRKKVEEMTGGKVAYIYLPNTHAAGHERFIREFYAQVGKQGAIIDERYNGGGFLADEVVDLLNQKPRSYIATREGEDQVFPRTIFGPKVMLINESAGSGGDYLPYTFRQANVGKLIGKRTWGGLVGIGGYPTLIDGGGVTAPHWALYFPSGKWDVENAGVAPDIEVELDPALVRAGRDPQLEKAIEVVKEQLAKAPPVMIKRPEYPNYHKKK